MKKLSLVWIVAVVGCGVGFSVAGEKDWNAMMEKINLNMELVKGLRSVQVPILKSKDFEEKWGKPRMEVGRNGIYRLSYSDPKKPFNRLVIYGSPKPFPKLTSPPKLAVDAFVDEELQIVYRPQKWCHVTVMDQKVRYFKEMEGGGADGDYYSTEGMSMKTPDGKVGYYRIVVEAGDDEALVRKRFSSVGF